jgi:hypothetical protein
LKLYGFYTPLKQTSKNPVVAVDVSIYIKIIISVSERVSYAATDLETSDEEYSSVFDMM